MADAKRDNNRITTLLAVSNVDGATPVILWADPTTHRLLVSSATSSHNFLSATHSDSVAASPVLGDIVYGDATPKWTKLAGNTTATKKFFTQTGDGAISAIPAWGTLASGDIPDISAVYAVINQTMYIGTTAVNINRVSASLNLAGIGTFGVGAITSSGTLALAANNITMTGSIGTTGSRLTKGWFTDLEVTNSIAGGVTGNAGTATALETSRTIGGTSFDGTANITVASATGGFTISGGDLALGANNLTLTGSIASTGSRVTKGWFTDLQVTNSIAGSITGNAATVTSFTPASGSLTLSGADALTLTTTASTNVTLPTSGTLVAVGTDLPLAGGTMTGDIQLGETDIKLDATLSGDEKWSGIVISGTGGATISVGDICYLASTGKWLLNDGILDGTDTGFNKQLGICVLASTDTNPIDILIYGKVRSAAFPAFTVGSAVYLDDTAGDLVVAQPSTANFAIRIVGYAITAEDLLFNPSNDYIVYV